MTQFVKHVFWTWIFLSIFPTHFISLQAQDTIFLKGDTIRVGELEWDMEKDWRSKGPLLSENPDLYGEDVKIFLGYHSNKNVEQIVFGYIDEEDGFVAHGPARYYYPSGHLLSKRYYIEGVLEGKAEDYHKNGKLMMKTWFREDVMDGGYRSFYENGITEQKGKFEAGEAVGKLMAFYSNGQPKWIEYYENGAKNGPDTTFYETGTVSAISNYFQDEEDGHARFFHRNGKPWTERVYENGRLKKIVYVKSKEGRPLEPGNFEEGWGWVNIYNDDGILIERDKYKDGYLRKTKKVKK
ncbi:MAG: hypothetical protein AAF570_06665 [Bacteroidota bacterium]